MDNDTTPPNVEAMLDGYLRGDPSALRPLDEALNRARTPDPGKLREVVSDTLSELLRPA
jgi:hypothetical protein